MIRNQVDSLESIVDSSSKSRIFGLSINNKLSTINFSSGYTLVEMIVVIGVTSLVMVMVTDTVLTFYRANTNTLEQAIQVDNARKGVEYLVRDLREAAYADDGSFPIVANGSTSISFYSDIDRDASVEKVRYFIDGTNLKKGTTNAAGSPPTYTGTEQVTLIAEYIRNTAQSIPVFRYYNASSTEVAAGATSTTISFVSVDLVVNVDVNRLPGQFTLHSSATIRNLKTQ